MVEVSDNLETCLYKVENDVDLESLIPFKNLKNCTIYQEGTKKFLQKYCFCSCDPNQMEQICESCANECHPGPDHVKSEFFEGMIKCQCGMKGHKIYKISSIIDKKCYYHELSQYSKKNVYYEDKKKKIICMYCNNFCLEDLAERGYSNFKRIEVAGNQTIPDCSCDNVSHKDLKIIFANINNFCKKTNNFEGMQSNHLLNLIFKCRISFNTIYSNFLSYLDKMKREIANNPLYEFDTNLKITNFYWSLKNFSEISKHSKTYNYFSDKINALFDYDYYCDIQNLKFEDKKYVWSCINMITVCFRKITFGNYFYCFPKVTFEDYENMNPLQRLIIVSRVKSDKNFMSIFIERNNKNIIDITTNAIESVVLIRFIFSDAFDLLINLFNILQKLAKFYLFSTKQVQNYSLLINLLIARIKDYSHNVVAEDYIHGFIIKQKITNIFINVVKTLIFLSFNYNDRVVYMCLNSKDKDVDSYNFYYSKNEIGKSLSKNCLDILHYIRIFLTNVKRSEFYKKSSDQFEALDTDDKVLLNEVNQEDFIDAGEIDEIEIKEEIISDQATKDKFKLLKHKSLGAFFTLDQAEDSNLPKIKTDIYKKLSHLITNATKLMNFSIGGVDPFAIGLRRCMTKNIKYNMKMIKNYKKGENDNKDYTKKEADFIEYVDNVSEKVELKYFQFFNFEYTEQNLIDLVIKSIDEVFEKFYVSMDEPIDIFEAAVQNTDEFGYNNDIESSKKPLQPNKNEIFSHEQFRNLINKTNFVFSSVKILNFIDTKKYSESPLYDKILQLLLFYIEDNTDNSINLLSNEYLNLLSKFPDNHCEKVFDLYYRITKILISSRVELVCLSNCTNTLMKYFLVIKVIFILLYFN